MYAGMRDNVTLVNAMFSMNSNRPFGEQTYLYKPKSMVIMDTTFAEFSFRTVFIARAPEFGTGINGCESEYIVMGETGCPIGTKCAFQNLSVSCLACGQQQKSNGRVCCGFYQHMVGYKKMGAAHCSKCSHFACTLLLFNVPMLHHESLFSIAHCHEMQPRCLRPWPDVSCQFKPLLPMCDWKSGGIWDLRGLQTWKLCAHDWNE